MGLCVDGGVHAWGVHSQVRQHSVFAACAPGTMPTAKLLCEPGATATHPTQANLTSRVLACPPSSCLSRGCPGHEFATKGLQVNKSNNPDLS